MKLNLKKFAAVLLLILTTTAIVNSPAKAQTPDTPQSYTWAYSHTNMYSANPVVYEFSGLDPNYSYEWTISEADWKTGEPVNVIGRLSTVGVSTTAWAAGAGVNGISWPTNYTGPVVVTDNYGNTLGQHFLAPAVENASTPTDWETDTANTSEDEKQTPGIAYNLVPCRNPAYASENPDGWHHTYLPCSTQVQQGDYWILHYRTDGSTRYGLDDRIDFQLVPNSTTAFTIDLDDVMDFNDGGWSTGLTELHYESFVVFSTTDDELAFVDYTKADTDFNEAGNPYRADFDYGVYSCFREDSTATWISDCESVLIISKNRPNIDLTVDALGSLTDGTFSTTLINTEWEMRAIIDQITVNGTQTVQFEQATEEVWDSYHGSFELISFQYGTLDNNIYQYAPQRTYGYSVGPSLAEDLLSWTVQASTLATNLASASDMEFVLYDTYLVVEEGQFTEIIKFYLDKWGLTTPFGNMVAFISLLLISFVLFGGWVFAMGMPAMYRYFVQMMIYFGVGGFWLGLGLSNGLTTVIFIVGGMVIVFFFWLMIGTGGENEMAIESY